MNSNSISVQLGTETSLSARMETETSLSAGLETEASFSGQLGTGTAVMNDFLIQTEEIDNGHRLTITRGSEVQTIDLQNGANGTPGQDAPQEAILYTGQSLTEEQQATARANISAADAQSMSEMHDELYGWTENIPAKYFKICFDEMWSADVDALSPTAAISGVELIIYDKNQTPNAIPASIAVVTADSEAGEAYAAENVLDGDDTTMWCSQEAKGAVHELVFTLQEPSLIYVVKIIPRVNIGLGVPDKLSFYASEDGAEWTEVGSFADKKDIWTEGKACYFAAKYITVEHAPVRDALDALIADVNALHPLTITAFSVSPSLAEKGSTVRAQSFSYSVNRMGAEVTLEGEAVSGGTASRADVLTEDRVYTLRATLGNVTKEKTVKLSFVAPLYYGVGADCTPESATVLALTRVLSTSRARSFTVIAGDGQYILFALPVALGAPTFKVGGFEGGFELQGEFDFTNASGHTEAYRLYRSTNAGLGSTTVSVS